MENKKDFSFGDKDEEIINLREEIDKYLIHWRFFLISIFLCVLLSFIYLRYATKIFNATATIMIKDNKNAGISTELAAFEDLGIIGGRSANNPVNEIEIIKSKKIIGYVVDSLNLNLLYFKRGRLRNSELYDETPIEIQLFDKKIRKKLDTIFSVTIIDENKFKLLDLNGENTSINAFNQDISNQLFNFKIVKKDNFKNLNFDNDNEIIIRVIPKKGLIESYRNSIEITPIDENSSVLILSLKGSKKEKIKDFLNELIRQYNLDAIVDNSQVSKKTKEFIDQRLLKIGEDLTRIQDLATKYKDKNKITGLSLEGEIALRGVVQNNEALIKLNTELNLATWVKDRLQKSNIDIIPENLGFTDINISRSIGDFNKLVLLRNKLALNAGERNPNFIQVNQEIVSLKNSLFLSIDNLTYSLKNQLKSLRKQADKLTAKVATIPQVERGFIDIARQQEIVSELYSYLLKKKEETAISLAVTVPKAKIVDVASGPDEPISPNKKFIYIGGFLVGLIIPFGFIFIKDLLDTKIHNRKDIEKALNIPFLGDIPHSETKSNIVVSKESRTSVAEAFRLLRTNLDFMLPSGTESVAKTIFITSTTSGEGKSFVSINLAATLALTGKKVLLLGFDLRSPKITEYFGIPERKGITNYILDDKLNADDIKFKFPEIQNVDIIPSGVIPPNPAELLLHDKVKKLFDFVKKDYDYVLVDTAPVNLVTDTLLISKYADMFLYVTRANYLDKRMLVVPETLYKEQRLPKMAMLLNGTDMNRGYGYGYGYGAARYFEDAKKLGGSDYLEGSFECLVMCKK